MGEEEERLSDGLVIFHFWVELVYFFWIQIVDLERRLVNGHRRRNKTIAVQQSQENVGVTHVTCSHHSFGMGRSSAVVYLDLVFM